MNTWFTSDLHFGHRNMVNWRNNRGCNFADADEMNEFIIERYNSVVKSPKKILGMALRKFSFSINQKGGGLTMLYEGGLQTQALAMMY